MEIENLHLPRRLKGRTLTATLILSLDIADADAAAVFYRSSGVEMRVGGAPLATGGVAAPSPPAALLLLISVG